MVEVAILGFVGARLASRVLEEEDDAVDFPQSLEVVGLEGYKLFELDILNTELFDEVREDAL